MSNNARKLFILLFWFHDDWGRYGRAYQRVAEHLAKLNEIGHVTCVFPPISRPSKKTLHIRPVSQKLTLVTEINLEGSELDRFFSKVRDLLSWRLKERRLRTYLRSIGYRKKNTVLWLFPPHHYVEHLVKTIPHRLVVAHVIDDFTKFDVAHPLFKAAQKQYPKLSALSDVIFTTSQTNHRKFAGSGRPCYLFYPAVDEMFVNKPQQLPHRLTGNPPRLGYVGFIMDRTDLDLLGFVAKRRPQWRLVLAGPQYPVGYLDESGLLGLPNIEYVGSMPQEQVPDFLKSLDVCIMPHRDNQYSRSMGPLKLYQYLASGRPIVSTDVAGLEKVREHVLVASDRNQFLAHIETALQSDTVERSKERIEAAKQNTWAIRVREMFDAVNERI